MPKNKIRLRIITPTRMMIDREVDMVVMRSGEGEIAFMAGHIPITTTLGYGIMKIFDGRELLEASVFGGFAEVINNVVTVLTDTAEWPDEIDIKRAEEAKLRAERNMLQKSESIDTNRAQLAFRRASVRLELSSFTISRGRYLKDPEDD